MQVLWANQNALTNFLDCLRNFIECAGQRLNVFALERRDEGLAKLFGELLSNFFVLAPAEDELFQALRRLVLLEPFQQTRSNDAHCVGLFRALFQQIVKLFVVPKDFLDRQHGFRQL